MPADSLQEFAEELRREGELVDVREPVSAKFEITEIADRVMKRTGSQAGVAGDRQLSHAPRRHLPQPCLRLHGQAVAGARHEGRRGAFGPGAYVSGGLGGCFRRTRTSQNP